MKGCEHDRRSGGRVHSARFQRLRRRRGSHRPPFLCLAVGIRKPPHRRNGAPAASHAKVDDLATDRSACRIEDAYDHEDANSVPTVAD